MQLPFATNSNTDDQSDLTEEECLDKIDALAQSLNDGTIAPTYSHEITAILISQKTPTYLLGLLRVKTKGLRLQGLILVEMLALTFRNKFFEHLQKRPQDFMDFVITNLNLYLNLSPQAESFYNGELTKTVKQTFRFDQFKDLNSSDISQLYKKINAALLFQMMKSITMHTSLEFSPHARSKMTDAFSSSDSLKRSNLRSSFISEPSRDPLLTEHKPLEPTVLHLHDIELSSIFNIVRKFRLDTNENQLEKLYNYSKQKERGSVISEQPSPPKRQSVVLTAPLAQSSNRQSVIVDEPRLERSTSHSENIDNEEWIVVDEDIPQPQETIAEEFKLFKKRISIGAMKLRNSFIGLMDDK